MGNNQAVKDEPVNKATIIYSNNDRYEGEFLYGQRNGYGTYTFITGEKYVGMWHENMKHGRGTMYYKNNDVYEGWWNKNMREGVGTHFYTNGDKYYGEWKINKKNGQGLFHKNNGEKFIGNFKDDKKHGIGQSIGLNNEKITEEWKNGTLIKKYEKPKPIDNNNAYLKFDSEQIQKYLDSKNLNTNEFKLNQVKSKQLGNEILKSIKLYNEKDGKSLYSNQNFLDPKVLVTQELISTKPDIKNWKIEDVITWFTYFDLDKFSDQIKENDVDGVKLFNLDCDEFSHIIKVENQADLELIKLSFENLKKVKKEADYIKNMINLKSIKSIGKKDKCFQPASTLIKSINKNKAITLIEEEVLGADNNSDNENHNKIVIDANIKETFSPCK